MIEALKPGVVSLIRDLNGNHVIQRCLQARCFLCPESLLTMMSDSRPHFKPRPGLGSSSMARF